jgi:hypothetical protein
MEVGRLIPGHSSPPFPVPRSQLPVAGGWRSLLGVAGANLSHAYGPCPEP